MSHFPKMVTVRMTEDERAQLRRRALNEGMTFNDWARVKLGLPTLIDFKREAIIGGNGEANDAQTLAPDVLVVDDQADGDAS